MSSKNGSFAMQIVAALMANIPALTYGIQIGWLSPMAPLLQSSLSPATAPLTDNHISWMATALSLSAVPSIPFFSYTSDKFGRKISLILISVFSAISWALKLWCINPTGLICARVFAGISAGGSFLVIPVYVREISDINLRGVLGSLLMTVCNVGVILVYVLGMYLPYFWNQAIFLFICFAHILLFLMMPESPAFSVKAGNYEQASKAIAWLKGVDIDDPIVHCELKQLKYEDEVFNSSPAITIKSIVKDRPVFRALIMCLLLVGTQALSGCFAVINYAATIFARAGASWDNNVLAVGVGSLQLAGSLVATSFVDRCGRKILLVSSHAVITVCMATVATVFVFDRYELGPLPQWLPVLAVCLCVFAYGAGVAPVPFIVMSEVYSFQLRARLTGVVMMYSWTHGSLTVFLFAPIANAFGEHVVFFGFAMVTLFGAFYTLFFVPETKGKSLEEVQMILSKK